MPKQVRHPTSRLPTGTNPLDSHWTVT